MAQPDRLVLGFVGDGGSMQTIQALASVARHKVGAKFVVCNNRSYRILKYNIQQYWNEVGEQDRDFPTSFDLDWPTLDFVALAQGQGVRAVKIERPEQIQPAIDLAFSDERPFLIDVVLSNKL